MRREFRAVFLSRDTIAPSPGRHPGAQHRAAIVVVQTYRVSKISESVQHRSYQSVAPVGDRGLKNYRGSTTELRLLLISPPRTLSSLQKDDALRVVLQDVR